MDLHGIVAGAINVVNPYVLGSIQISTGNIQNPDGSGELIPTYRTMPQVPMQVQDLSFKDLHQVDALNLQGVSRSIYVRGSVDGLVRAVNKGGDIVTLPDGTVWLVCAVLEAWPDWCKLAVTLQNGS